MINRNSENKEADIKENVNITEGEQEQNDRIKAALAEVDWLNTSLEDLEEVFEDRDPTEFL
jgi:hypothetical protein